MNKSPKNITHKPVSIKQMREIDRRTIEDIGIPSIVLMDNAGRITAETILRRFPGARKAAIFCGGGSNGGDGFVCARYLFNRGINVEVILVKKPGEHSGDALTNLKIITNLQLKIKNVTEYPLNLKKYDLLVDALLGTGTKGEIKGIYAEVISAINDSGRPVVSIDIPSGLDADTGLPLGICVKAKLTVTIGCLKKGFLLNNSVKLTGNVVVADIGLQS